MMSVKLQRKFQKPPSGDSVTIKRSIYIEDRVGTFCHFDEIKIITTCSNATIHSRWFDEHNNDEKKTLY